MNPNTHFYLYSKGWYDKSDSMTDLKIILANYTGLDVKNVTDDSVISKLSELVWFEINKSGNAEYHFHHFLMDVLRRGMVAASLGFLSIAPTGDKGRERLGKPSEKILPLTEETKKALSEKSFNRDFKWAKE